MVATADTSISGADLESGWDFRVLVADDDASCRGSVASLLTHEGFQTFPAECGGDALECIRARQSDSEERIHFLVADYNMPDFTGLELLRRISALGVVLPTIVVSGEFSVELQRSVIDEGGFALFPKPIQPLPFRELIWKLVRSYYDSGTSTES